MTTLHMEVETARNTQNTMNNTSQQLRAMFDSLNNSVNGLQGGAWQGNSATEFFGLYDQWRSQINGLLERLTEMNQKLATEITEWEQMASKLS